MAYGDSTLRQCVKKAQELIDSGEALEKLEDFVRTSKAEAA
jgi:anthranilate phosphoribosyltransferase